MSNPLAANTAAPPETSYPNREHQKADEAARRRALAWLAKITEEAATLTRRVKAGHADGADASQLTEQVRQLTENLAILETLRDVRDWHAAREQDRLGFPHDEDCPRCGRRQWGLGPDVADPDNPSDAEQETCGACGYTSGGDAR